MKDSRRKFIKKAAGSALGMIAAPYIIPGTALGKNGAIAPSNRIVLGGIGLGSQGMGNSHGFLQKKEVQYVAICDVDASHRDKAISMINGMYKNNDCRSYGDYREFLEKEKLDAVTIAVPDHWHALIGIEAARQHKNMYYEKPLTRYFNEAKAVRDAVNNSGVVFQHGTQQRSDARYRQAVEIVRNQLIGKLERVIVGSAPYSEVPHQPAQPVAPGFDYDM